MQTILTVIFALLTLLAVSLQRTYSQVSLKELKYRARRGDVFAESIMKIVGYGHSLRAVLWFMTGVFSAGFFVLVGQTAPFWFALTTSGIVVWLGFVWIPAGRVTNLSLKTASWIAPILEKLLFYIHPIIDWIVRRIRHFKPLVIHTGLYDKYDLIDMLEQQQVQPDNRIEQSELDLALNALKFGDDKVIHHMIPKRVVKSVSVDEPLGPVLMDELHQSGFSRFPVYEGKKDNIVGTLYLKHLVNAKQGGNVRNLMKPDVYYVHEDQSLNDALQAILKTHHQLFIVVNNFEEFVGIITAEDILETLIGAPITDEFDQYDDLRAVATSQARVEHEQHQEEQTEAENNTENAE